MLHLLTENADQLKAILKRSHPNLESNQFKYHVPFLPNFQGHTPFHFCIHRQDYKTIDIIFKYLKYYPADHHSRSIRDLYGEMIDKQVPEFMAYLESRFIENPLTKKFSKGTIKAKSRGMGPFDLWFY